MLFHEYIHELLHEFCIISTTKITQIISQNVYNELKEKNCYNFQIQNLFKTYFNLRLDSAQNKYIYFSFLIVFLRFLRKNCRIRCRCQTSKIIAETKCIDCLINIRYCDHTFRCFRNLYQVMQKSLRRAKQNP